MTSRTANGVTTYYIYDTEGKLISALNEAGTPIEELVYLEGEPIAQTSKADSSASMHFIHNDHLGAPIMATGAAKEVTWEIEATPYGETYAVFDQGVGLNLRFPGQYALGQPGGVSENHYRTYDPSLGRYLQSDPIGLSGGLNTYAYALGNPTNNTDANGLFITPQTVGGAVGLVGGFVYSYVVNGNDIGTALADGVQAGAAGFISGGGSLFTGFAVASSASLVRSRIQCGEVDGRAALNAAANGGLAVVGGALGKAAGALIPPNYIRVERGFFGRMGQKLGLLGPKYVDTRAHARELVSAGAGVGLETGLAGAYSGAVDPCGCIK